MNNPCKAKNRRQNERERSQKALRLQSYPMQIQIELTNRCNLACASCARNYYDKAENPPGDFNPDRYPQLETLFQHAESVLLGGCGEPLMGRFAERVMRLAAAKGCFIELITNGTFLDRERLRWAADIPVGRFLFSVDAACDETMRRLRGISLDEVLKAVGDLKRAAPGTDSAFLFTLSRENRDELAPLVEIAAGAGVGDIHVAHQKLYTRGQKDFSALRDCDALERVFEEAGEAAVKWGVALHLPPTRGTHPCLQPLELMMIRNDGMAMACCSALFGGGGPRIELGYLDSRDVLELWNAPQAQNARAGIYGLPHEPGPCDGCAFRVHTPEAMERFLD